MAKGKRSSKKGAKKRTQKKAVRKKAAKKAKRKVAKKARKKAAKRKAVKKVAAAPGGRGLIMFYGEDCPHCDAMMPLVDRLDAELGMRVRRVEVWHSVKNERAMRKHEKAIKIACGGGLGVPAFVNKSTGEALCGEQTYNVLKAWAKGEL